MSRWLVVVLVLTTGVTSAAPVPKVLKRAKPLRATIEPLPGEKLYSVDWDDVPFSRVAEWVERETGLLFLSKEMPKVKITLKAQGVCMPELFALLDEELFPQGWVLMRSKETFSPHSIHARVPQWRRWVPTIKTLKELERRSPYEPHAIVIPFKDGAGDAIDTVRDGIDGKMFEAQSLGPNQVMVRGRTMDIQQFVDKMGDHVKK